MNIQAETQARANARKACDAWMATEAFTDFVTAQFAAAVLQAVADQPAAEAAVRNASPPK